MNGTLYENIRRFRMKNKMSQGDLAKLTGYASNSMIAQIEDGAIDLHYSKILKFAEALNVPVPVLLGYIDEESITSEIANLPKKWQEYMGVQLKFAKQTANEEKEIGELLFSNSHLN